MTPQVEMDEKGWMEEVNNGCRSFNNRSCWLVFVVWTEAKWVGRFDNPQTHRFIHTATNHFYPEIKCLILLLFNQLLSTKKCKVCFWNQHFVSDVTLVPSSKKPNEFNLWVSYPGFTLAQSCFRLSINCEAIFWNLKVNNVTFDRCVPTSQHVLARIFKVPLV